MGRPRKPIELIKLEGGFRPVRHDESLSVPTKGSPCKPRGLSAVASRFWDDIIAEMIELEIVKRRDEPALVEMARWWAVYQRAMKKAERDYRFAKLAIELWRQFDSIAMRFGLTPSDRLKLRGTTGKTKADTSKTRFLA